MFNKIHKMFTTVLTNAFYRLLQNIIYFKYNNKILTINNNQNIKYIINIKIKLYIFAKNNKINLETLLLQKYTCINDNNNIKIIDITCCQESLHSIYSFILNNKVIQINVYGDISNVSHWLKSIYFHFYRYNKNICNILIVYNNKTTTLIDFLNELITNNV